MGKLLTPNIDLSSITPGTGEFYQLDKPSSGSLVSIEIEQSSVSAIGVNIKVIQSNSGQNWFDVLEDEDDPTSTTEFTTIDVNEGVFLSTDFLEAEIFGIFVDVAGATNGELIVTHSVKPSFI